MSKKNMKLHVALLVLGLGMFIAAPAFAGSAIVGSVAGSMNATIGGQPVLQGHTLFSGDSLKVTEGAAVVIVGKGSRLVFGRDSDVLFSREGESVTVHLLRGDISLFQPSDEGNGALRVKIDNVTIAPGSGFKTLGQVAMVGDTVLVSAREGQMKVEWADGKTAEVAAGKSLKLVPKTQRAPQEATGSQHYGYNTDRTLEWVAAGGAGLAAILAGVAISHASNATTAANNANSNAIAATNAANAATAAATSAGAAANAATAAANAANSTATLANSSATAAFLFQDPSLAAQAAAYAAVSGVTAAQVQAFTQGCISDIVSVSQGQASPYTPPTGFNCGTGY